MAFRIVTGGSGPAPGATGENVAPQQIADKLFAAIGNLLVLQATIGVARDAVDSEDNYNLWRVLSDVYERLDAHVVEMNEIGVQARQAKPRPQLAGVPHA